jgi:hypothetical protein
MEENGGRRRPDGGGKSDDAGGTPGVRERGRRAKEKRPHADSSFRQSHQSDWRD